MLARGNRTTPPNNWRSKFGGSAWQWHAPSQQHYLHLFAPQQADLNWEHAPMREALCARRCKLSVTSVTFGQTRRWMACV
ncbi:MAG: alpha-amylase family glycosyl hydrolase [Symbiopectobacterium sp.]